jgi:hypothetical protein
MNNSHILDFARLFLDKDGKLWSVMPATAKNLTGLLGFAISSR